MAARGSGAAIGRRRRHRGARRYLPRLGGRWLGAAAARDGFLGERVRDGRDAAPNDSPAVLLGRRLFRLPPRRARWQRGGPHLRVSPVRHVDSRRLPHPVGTGLIGSTRPDPDDRCRLPLDESGGSGAAQGNPDVRQAGDPGCGRAARWPALHGGRPGPGGRAVRGHAARRYPGVDGHLPAALGRQR